MFEIGVELEYVTVSLIGFDVGFSGVPLVQSNNKLVVSKVHTSASCVTSSCLLTPKPSAVKVRVTDLVSPVFLDATRVILLPFLVNVSQSGTLLIMMFSISVLLVNSMVKIDRSFPSCTGVVGKSQVKSNVS